jgi:predicted ATP-binding protein involved in virulence
MNNTYIEKLNIVGLFDRFNYEIDLSNRLNDFCLITAPNGFGKSTILNIIHNFTSGNYLYFYDEVFQKITFYLNDKEPITIVKTVTNIEGFESKSVTISQGNKRKKIKLDLKSFEIESTHRLSMYLPISQVGSNEFIDDETDQVLTKVEVINKFRNHPYLRDTFKEWVWLDEITKNISCFTITTHRLKVDVELKSRNRRDRYQSNSLLMVSKIANQIKDEIEKSIRAQYDEGRIREMSFPTRLIDSLNNDTEVTKDDINNKIQNIQEFEEKYGKLGLVPTSETTQKLSVQAQSTEHAGMLVLKTYLSDILDKFKLLEGLSKKLDVFISSINNLISFKKIQISNKKGFIVVSNDERQPDLEIPLSSLSSGEQHLIVLIGQLIFSISEGSLVLIDEPEISFHPEWQEQFLSILTEIQQLNKFSTVIATHSPMLIQEEYLEDVIELAELYRKQLDEKTVVDKQ